MPLLSLDRVSRTYFRGGRHKVVVLRDVSFSIETGEFVAIVGDPMSGKTTLLHIASGLEAPETGTVRWQGRKLVVSNDLDERLAMVARVAPPRETMLMRMLDLIAVPLLDSTPWRDAHRRVTDVLEAFGIKDLARAKWHELSDVERTLVRIAQAIIRKPSLLLVDDPMPGLGLAHVETVLAVLRRAASDDGTAILMTVGNLADAERADRVLTLSAGTLVQASSGSRGGGRVVDFPAERGA